jgi:hypothetical protein
MSFDITIGFDTTLLRPTDGLTTNTLAEQMKFADISPSFNFVVPGEMRASAFTITRNVKGNLPLFAIAGDFKGACGDVDSLTLPWPAEYNGEFKNWTKVFKSAKVVSIASAKQDTTQGVNHKQDEVVFTTDDSTRQVEALVDVSKAKGGVAKLTFRMINKSVSQIESYNTAASVLEEQYNTDSTMLNLTIRTSKTVEVFNLTLATEKTGTTAVDTLLSSVEIPDTCECIIPAAQGSTRLVLDRPVVSTSQGFIEGPAIQIRHRADQIQLQILHGNPTQVVVSDLFGKVFAALPIGDHQWLDIPTAELAHGVYLLQVRWPHGSATQLFQR